MSKPICKPHAHSSDAPMKMPMIDEPSGHIWGPMTWLMIMMCQGHLSAQQFPEVPQDVGPTGAALHLEPIPPSPNYNHGDCWALAPVAQGHFEDVGRATNTNLSTPKGRHSRALTNLTNGADVFYLHPTLLLEGAEWNADVYDEEMNSEVDKWPVRHQASAFAGAGRVFAPRYRQAHVRIFDLGDSLSYAAAAVAYGDIRRAFLHYMENWNEGRPIILAGHSQGSYHGRTLLQEFFDTEQGKAQLVAAYLPGMDMYLDDFEAIELCEGPEDTGCLCTWMTYHDGHLPKWLAKKNETRPAGASDVPLCINPISWRTRHGWSSLEHHLGLVRPGYWLSRSNTLQGRVSEQGVFHVQRPKVLGAKWFHRDDWHSGDINLVWANVHENVQRRTRSWHKDNGD